jgi:hypothetical protein
MDPNQERKLLFGQWLFHQHRIPRWTVKDNEALLLNLKPTSQMPLPLQIVFAVSLIIHFEAIGST